MNNEIDNGPLSNADLAAGAVKSIVGFMALKWIIIFGVTRALKRAAEK